MPPMIVPDCQIAQQVIEANFPDPVFAVGIIFSESDGNAHAVNINPANPKRGWPKTVDRGLWQINNYWHPDIPDAVAFDPVLSTQAAHALSKEGTDFRPWALYVREPWRVRTPRAQAAVDLAKLLKGCLVNFTLERMVCPVQ